MPSRFVFGKGGDPGPRTLAGGAHEAKDFLELVFVGGAWEEGTAGVHFSHDAAGGPDVDAGVVGSGTKQDVWGAVPEGDDLVGEGVDGNAKGSSETEIGEFELPLVVDEEILGFEVAVQDAVLMAKCDTLEELVHEGFDRHVIELTALTARVHEFLEIFVHVLKDEHELVLSVDDVVEGDDVFMLELFHERDFANGGGRCAFFAVEVDFFEGDEFAGLAVAAFEHGRIGAFT